MSSTQGVKILSNRFRTHTCGELRASDAGSQVRLSGWVHARRDHGGLIFIDLRDRWGVTQLTFDPDKNKEAWAGAEKLRDEFVVTAEGEVRQRPDQMVNNNIDTGAIEVEVSKLTVESESKTPPFPIASEEDINEDLRLKYRFLDLRHKRLQDLMVKRDQLISAVREYMKKHWFVEVQTPILANSSPEGARDFLVPSRLHPGTFYALPQAPQQYKQLLMVAGLDRYFQIAPCFRDEDPRADRHSGDFYQIDMEMSFVQQEDVFAVAEPLMIELTKKFSSKKILQDPFPRISWREAMNKYGSDKPDLRYSLLINDISEDIKESKFEVFSRAIKDGGVVHALRVEGGAKFSRKDIDELTDKAKEMGAGGLAYIAIKDQPVSPILKFLDKETVDQILKKTGAASGDIIFFGAGRWLTVCKVLGAVREMSAVKLNLKDASVAAWCWITDFPMYEYDETAGKIDFSHNPFSMPQGGLEALETDDPTKILGYQYDLALNGFEVSSGAIRNHRPDIMYKAFAIAGYSREEVDEKFGGMLRAFEYGAPPHGGMAPGLDRIMMVLMDLENIRDIYAFPKNGRGQDVMMNSPSKVGDKHLKELGIKIEVED